MARRVLDHVTVSVDVDLDDLAELLTSEQISKLAESVGDSGPRDAVSRAINQIRMGNPDQAITLLEREFMPTWKSRANCQAKYDLAMKLSA